MKGQIHEELDQLDNARESYKLGVCLQFIAHAMFSVLLF